MRRGASGEMGWPVFGLPPWKKIFGGVIAIISFRPGGWMQQSAVPTCAILSGEARKALAVKRREFIRFHEVEGRAVDLDPGKARSDAPASIIRRTVRKIGSAVFSRPGRGIHLTTCQRNGKIAGPCSMHSGQAPPPP